MRVGRAFRHFADHLETFLIVCLLLLFAFNLWCACAIMFSLVKMGVVIILVLSLIDWLNGRGGYVDLIGLREQVIYSSLSRNNLRGRLL